MTTRRRTSITRLGIALGTGGAVALVTTLVADAVSGAALGILTTMVALGVLELFDTMNR